MGLRSKLKKALGKVVQSIPGSDKIQKVIGKDPIAQMVMKVDPLARDIGDVHGLRAQAQQDPGVAPVVGERRPNIPTSRNPGWQADRIAAMRSRFGRPGAAPAATPGAAPTVQPVAPAVTATPPAPTVMPAPVQAMPPAVPTNPVAQDIDAYSQAWEGGRGNYSA